MLSGISTRTSKALSPFLSFTRNLHGTLLGFYISANCTRQIIKVEFHEDKRLVLTNSA